MGDVKYKASGEGVGSGGVSTASFKTTAEGASEIKLGYLRTFEDKPAIKQFLVTLQISKSAEKDPGEKGPWRKGPSRFQIT